jgi:cell division protein FtsA
VEVPCVGGRTPRLLSRHLLSQIIEARAEEIFGLVKQHIAKAGAEESLAAGIVLTGGSARLDAIVALAEEVFGMPVRVGVPVGVAAANGAAEAIGNPAFAAAVGLAQYGTRLNDYGALHADDAPLFHKVRQRLKGWMEVFF